MDDFVEGLWVLEEAVELTEITCSSNIHSNLKANQPNAEFGWVIYESTRMIAGRKDFCLEKQNKF